MKRVRHGRLGREGTVLEGYEGGVEGLSRVHLDGDEPDDWHFYADCNLEPIDSAPPNPMAMYVSHPECGAMLIEWPEMLIPGGDLSCRHCGQDLDPRDETCDASVAAGRPHHMQCPTT